MKEEYEDLLRQKNAKQAEQVRCQEKNATIEKDIERLEEVKQQLCRKKEDYIEIVNAFRRYPEQYLAEEWRGQVYDEVTEEIWNDLQLKEMDIVEKIDEKSERINEKIQELNEERISNNHLLLSIGEELSGLERDLKKSLD